MKIDEISETEKKLAVINETIKRLDPAIRAAAFDVLAPKYFDELRGQNGKTVAQSGSRKDDVDVGADSSEFFAKFDHAQPSKNLLLIVAWLYSQYGKYPITRAVVNAYAADTGLTVPDRPDVTMRQAKHDGKSLFRQKGRGWELTVSGEARIKELYSVKKGSERPPSPAKSNDDD